MQDRYPVSELRSDSGYSTLTLGLECLQELSGMPGSPVTSRNTTCNDKSNGCEKDTQKRRSSRTSGVASTSGEKVCGPYWNEACRENSLQLWLPTATGLPDSDSNSSSGYSSATVEKSWFSVNLQKAVQPKNSLKTCLRSSPSFPLGCTDSENIVVKSRKIKLYPTPEQSAKLRQWMAASRWCYNQTIDYINRLDGPRPHWTQIKKAILVSCPEWMKAVPFQVKGIAVKDACEAFSAQKKKAKQTGSRFRMSFRSRRNPKQSCFIPSSAIKSKADNAIGVYLKIAGIFRAAEPLPQQHRDSRLVWEHGAWFLAVSFRERVQQKAENQGRACSLDPGVRTFQTVFSIDRYGKIGDQAQQRIVRLMLHLDELISRRATACKRAKRRLTLAINRLRRKIGNLTDELHWKTIRVLLNEFDVVVVPPFSAGRMSSRANRKLRNKSVRAMLGLAHSKFRQRLQSKANQESKTVLIQDEAYTSKTCSWSGEVIQNLGGRRRVRGSDGVSIDRDINGARGVFLRALVDTPLRLESSRLHAACEKL